MRNRIERHCLWALGVAVSLFLVLFSSWMPARAQEPISLDTLTIALWPEYDREGVLVIYRGVVSGKASLPVTLRFRIPKSTLDVGGTAGVDAQGEFHYYRPTIRDLGDALEVVYTSPYPAFQFEYYDGGLQTEGESRSFAFDYQADYEVGSLVLEAQEPAGSSEFATDPEGVQVDDPLGSGLKVRQWSVGPASRGARFAWQIRYRKSDPRLSAEILGLPTPGTSPYEGAASEGRTLPSGPLLVGIAVAAVAAAFAGLYFGLLRPRMVPQVVEPPRPKGKRRRKPKKRAPGPSPAPVERDIAQFCHQCGYRFAEEDRFCPQCGARRKGM